MPESLSREQLIRELATAFEQLIAAATEAERRSVTRRGDIWGPREIVAHMAGWEIIAVVHIPNVVAGMPSAFAAGDAARQTVMDNAINEALVTLVGDQSLDALCGILRRAYQRDVEMLKTLDDTCLQPGEYVYERTLGVIDHCREHMEALGIGE